MSGENPIRSDGVARSYGILEVGELVVGIATTRIKTASFPCALIWVGAPTAQHVAAAANTTPILIGNVTAQTMTLDPADTSGFHLPLRDAADVYFTGFTAGDVVEYIIFG